jgi:hypothetical protein
MVWVFYCVLFVALLAETLNPFAIYRRYKERRRTEIWIAEDNAKRLRCTTKITIMFWGVNPPTPEMNDWAEQNIKGLWYLDRCGYVRLLKPINQSRATFYFEDPDEAMRFKLRFAVM